MNGQVLNAMKSLQEHPDGEPAKLTSIGKGASEDFDVIHPPEVSAGRRLMKSAACWAAEVVATVVATTWPRPPCTAP